MIKLKLSTGSAYDRLITSAVFLVIVFCSISPARPDANLISTTAAEASPAQEVSLDALIDGLQAKYSRMRGLEADFVQVYYGRDGRTLREAGHLILKRPGKARWVYSEPERKTFVSDGKNIYFYVSGDRHATRALIKASVDPQIPFLFLLGRGNIRQDFSRVELITTEQPVVAGNRVLRLFPKRAPEQFRQLVVEVSPATFEVKRLVIFERSGARMDFVLANVRENSVAPDSQFQFVAPPGVVIRDAQ